MSLVLPTSLPRTCIPAWRWTLDANINQVQRHFRSHHRSFRKGDHLPSHRWYEGQGRPRRVFCTSDFEQFLGNLVLTPSPTLPCWPLRMSLESARKSESPLSTSSSGLPVVPEPSSPVQEDRPLSELSPVPVCESVESKTSPLPHPTLPGRRVVDEDEGFRMRTFSIWEKCFIWELEWICRKSKALLWVCAPVVLHRRLLARVVVIPF